MLDNVIIRERMHFLEKFFMAIPLRTEDEIVKLREACKLASDVLVMIEPYVKAGVSTGELDRICHEYMVNEQKLFQLV